jgi:hypothetical protein
MKLIHKESRLERLVKTVNPFDRPSKSKFGLPSTGSGNGLPAGLSQDKAAKAGLVAGGLAVLTAASAGISSLRRTGRSRDYS